MTTFTGTTGDDNFGGTAGSDDYQLAAGGEDTAAGGDGQDTFHFGASFSAGDQIDGGAEFDIAFIDGDYAGAISLTAANIHSVERFVFGGGHDYDIVLGAGVLNLAMTLFTSGAGGHSVSIDDSAGVAGTGLYVLHDGGDFVLHGGAAIERVELSGADSPLGLVDVDLGAGDDSLSIYPQPPAGAHFAGGEGTDLLVFDGRPTKPFNVNATVVSGFETIEFSWGGDIRIADNIVPPGGVLAIHASTTLAKAMLDASRVKHGAVDILGGTIDDTLIGGHGDDTITSRTGNDVLIGNGGADVIDASQGGVGTLVTYLSTKDSTRKAPDLVTIGSATIDLSAIDADTATDGDQAFVVVDHFGHHAGELTVKYRGKLDLTAVSLDVDGDGKADAVINLAGDHRDFDHFVL